MKNPNIRYKFGKGFTLVELLVAISIVIVLAGLSFGVLSYVQQRQARETARVQLGLLELGLESYFADHGEYPENRRSNGERGSDDLQRALFPPEEDGKIYVVELDPENDTQGWLSGSGNSFQILDPWGEEYRFRSSTTQNVTANPGFDLWSAGPDGESATSSNGGYDPEAPANLDDIRLW